MLRKTAASLVLLLAAAALPGAPAGAHGLAPLRWDGSALRDDAGRAVVLRGLNVVFKHAPYHPATDGAAITADSFNDADAALLQSWGFNVVRLGLIWKGVETAARGAYDNAYLDRIEAIVDTLAARGIYALLDFHQDVFNERYAGEGAPDWALQSPVPPTNTGNWGGNYFTPAVMNEYDLFWANAGETGTAYAQAWRHVAERFAGNPAVLGYDVFNEPWPGTHWPSCANTIGCVAFEDLLLDVFYQRAIDAIRTVDADHMIYVAPAIPSNFGAGVNIGPFTDPGAMPGVEVPQIGMSYHVYCLEGSLDGSFSGQGASCETLESRATQTQTAHAAARGWHPILSEFGASDDLNDVGRLIALNEAAGTLSWIYWAYKQFDDPTGSPTESVLDPVTQLPKPAKVALLARPYARAVAGTLAEHRWDPTTRTLRVAYTTGGGDTEIVWPAAQGAFAASVGCEPVTACSIVSPAGASPVVVRATDVAKVVAVATGL